MSLNRRLLPLQLSAMFQGVVLWVPVEKLFMSEIGFTAASVGIMAAAYAALVPVLEIPSGILADRWSRRGVLIVANVALLVSTLLGGMSTNVPTYIGSAMFLGVFFAMQSGTADSIVYDTVLEETGGSAEFERRLGRIRVVTSAALVASSLVGGCLATLTSTRLTYFLTVPFVALAIVALTRLREPRLHKAAEPTSLRSHIATTYRTILRRGPVRPIIAIMVLTGMLMNVLFEFGPLWLVALAAPAVLYGPATAGLTSSLGLGGWLAGRLRLSRPVTMGAVVAAMLAAGVTLTVSRSAIVVIVAQVVLAVLIMTVSTFLSGRLHDAVPSTIRSGVASGVGTFSWLTFLPFALVFGLVSERAGVHTAGWMIVAGIALAGLSLLRMTLRRAAKPAPVQVIAAEVAPEPAAALAA